MAQIFDSLSDEHRLFIERQKVFFVGTAARDGRVNVSPKGQPSLTILDPTRILWLSLTGSGNETAAHLIDTNRMTLMWCAFEGPPRILRVYGRAQAIYPDHDEWEACTQRIPAPAGARQYYTVEVETVQTSCGYAVPFMDYREDRDTLTRWTEKKTPQELHDYRVEKNTLSIDGFPTRTA